MNLRHTAALALVGWYLMLPLGGCSSRHPYCLAGTPDADYPCPYASLMGVETCQSWDGKWGYLPKDGVPQACIAYSEQQEKEAEAAADAARAAAEQQEKERKAALEKAARELLAESPVHDEQTYQQDLAVLKMLTRKQWDAIRDVGNKVDLTTDEDKALASISRDQRHALSQMLAFFAWLKDQEKQAQQAADQQRLAVYQALIVAAASQQAQATSQQAQAEWQQARAAQSQAEAAQWQARAAQSQAGALWRQQRCLENLSQGQPCY